MSNDRSQLLSPHFSADSDSSDDSATGLPPIYAPAGSADFYAASAAPGTAGSSAKPTAVLYLTPNNPTSSISASDLYQGQIGDCFLISSIGELALNSPSTISGMIHVNSNGTETVTLHEASNGSLPSYNTTAFKAVQVTVTNVFPSYSVDNGATQDVSGNQKQIWPQVLEKAVATLDGGYGAIANGGSPLIAMEELSGQATSYMSPANLTLAALANDVKAGDLIVMDTANSSSLPDGLVGDHAYMFQSVTGSGSSAMVHLLNPWGYDEPAAIPFAQLSKGIVEVDIGHA